MTMTEMLEATFEKLEAIMSEDPKYFWGCGKSFDIDGVGTVHCTIDTAQGANTWMRKHYRRKWKLDGKVISADNLAKIVGA
jgi:hypothetical protein